MNDENENNSNKEKEPQKMEQSVELKKGFFKKVWYSIFKLEKYGEMSAEGVGRAITYIMKLALIIAIVICLGTVFQINQLVQKGITFLDEQVGDFTYSDGILQISDGRTVRAPSSMFGEVIIDTNIGTNEEVDAYLNSMKESKGILILKNQVIIKGISSNGLLNYKYSSILGDANIEQMNKQQLVEYLNGSDTWKIYVLVFVLLLGYALINSFLSILFNVIILSLFGYIATWFARIKMRYAAIFNLAAYSLTLSVLLNVLYIMINIFTNFTITYFQIMYVAVAAIYLIASIFLIKSDFIKMQTELIKNIQIKNEEEQQEENEEEKQEEKKEEKEDKENEKKEKEKDKNKDTNNGEEPEGSQA